MNFFTTVQGPSLIISSEFRCGHTFCSSKTPLSKVWRILLHFYHRLWTTTTHPPDPNSPGHVRAQRIGYHDIMPARLESNPDAFGPKYESLSDAMKSFNQKLRTGEEEISGNLQSGIPKLTKRGFAKEFLQFDPFWFFIHCASVRVNLLKMYAFIMLTKKFGLEQFFISLCLPWVELFLGACKTRQTDYIYSSLWHARSCIIFSPLFPMLW